MLERGYSVRLLTDTGSSVPGPDSGGFGADSSDTAGIMLDTLAVVDHSDGAGLSAAHDVLRAGSEGLLVAFLGDLDEKQASIAGRMRLRAGGAVAFVMDSAAWAPPDPAYPDGPQARAGTRPGAEDTKGGARRPVRILREAGWTVLQVSASDGLAELWQRADRYRSRKGAGTG
jgi:hypothetical protein